MMPQTTTEIVQQREAVKKMSDAEFADAVRRRAWAPPPSPPAALSTEETAQRRAAVAAMTNAEFNAAVAKRDWNKPSSQG